LNTIFERAEGHLVAFIEIAFISILSRRLVRLVTQEISACRLQTDSEELSGHTVLLVEDDPLIGMALAAHLQETGLSVIKATSAASAPARLDQQKTPFDLVLSDYQLGDGNGLDIIETARKRWSAPAILLTGDTAPSILNRTWPIESGKEAKPLMFNGCRCEGLHYTMVARWPPIP
jgi:CheY-like chemotaxis protein